MHAGGNYDAASPAIGNNGTHKAAVDLIAETNIAFQLCAGILVHRNGFPRQSRLLHFQVHGRSQPDIGRNIITGFQQDNITGHQIS